MLRRISFVFLLLFSLTAHAVLFTDLKFGTKQFGDSSSWNVYNCTYTTSCTAGNISSVGSMRNGNGQNFTLGATQYLKFSYTNTVAGEPWTITAYNANGTVAAVLGTYRILIAGTGYFMTSNQPHPNAGNGSLWSTQVGMVSYAPAVTFTGTSQPTPAQMDALADSYYSPTPIYTSGQTYTPPPPPYSSGITTTQQASKTANTLLRQAQSSNLVDIEQIGDNNNITIRQGTNLAGKNRMTVYSSGNSNTLNLNQGYTTTGQVSIDDSNNHFLNLHLSGNNNNVTTRQTGNGQYMETTISGSINVLNLQQTGGGSKTMFTNVNGNNNTLSATQDGLGTHYLDVKLLGNGHTVNALQQGTGNHAATIDLNNTGGSSTVNMTQQGSTAQTYSIQQSCATAAGCSTTIVQGQ